MRKSRTERAGEFLLGGSETAGHCGYLADRQWPGPEALLFTIVNSCQSKAASEDLLPEAGFTESLGQRGGRDKLLSVFKKQLQGDRISLPSAGWSLVPFSSTFVISVPYKGYLLTCYSLLLCKGPCFQRFAVGCFMCHLNSCFPGSPNSCYPDSTSNTPWHSQTPTRLPLTLPSGFSSNAVFSENLFLNIPSKIAIPTSYTCLFFVCAHITILHNTYFTHCLFYVTYMLIYYLSSPLEYEVNEQGFCLCVHCCTPNAQNNTWHLGVQ